MFDPLQQTLVQLTAENPTATRVLRRHGLNYWSRGRRTVTDACREIGLDPRRLLRDVDRIDEKSEPGPRWTIRSLSDLIEYIECREHPRIRRELGNLMRRARNLQALSGGELDFSGVVADLEELAESLAIHTEREEEVLFPLFLEGRARGSSESIHSMEVQHDDQLRLVGRVTDAVERRQRRDRAANLPWTGFDRSLDRFEFLLTEHIHLENNTLFPRGFFESRC